jgi:hypothetical protein
LPFKMDSKIRWWHNLRFGFGCNLGETRRLKR